MSHSPYRAYSPGANHSPPREPEYQAYQNSHQQQQPYSNRAHPAAHPDSAYNRLNAQRFDGPDYPPELNRQYSREGLSNQGRHNGNNYGPAAVGGGMTGMGAGAAQYHGRDDVPRGYHPDSNSPYLPSGSEGSVSRGQEQYPASIALGGPGMDAPRGYPPQARSHTNLLPESGYPGNGQQGHYDDGPYDDPYQRQRRSWGGGAADPGAINPHDIVDDGDDGFMRDPPKRRSVLGNLGGKNSSNNSIPVAAGAGAGAAAAGGAAMGASASRSVGQLPGASGGGNMEKNDLLAEETARRKKKKRIILVVLGILLLAAIAGGVAGGILGTRGGGSKSGGSKGDKSDDDNLDDQSDDIKELLNNKDLHKVFPGMAYTPWGTQYPLCEKYPPSQNNVTRDMAVLSQLTNTIRLYGTDCNQTEMVLHAIDQLKLKDMKLWLGVWIEHNNETTSDRQVKQMYKILKDEKKKKDLSVFRGVVVGNEVLYRGKLNSSTPTMLKGYIKDVKAGLKKMDIDLPVGTSDLGDNWTKGIADICDVVMSNVHPFFGGTTAEKAAGWAWDFWQGHNVVLTEGTKKQNIVSEVGWPSGGGSSKGAVAGIKQMNQFMDDWVCPSLKNGTDYLWFEAFDEPWKESFNEKGKAWEDKWGLMDPARKLKSGLKIPDCGGKTIPKSGESS